MSAEENTALFRRYVEEAWAKGVWRWRTTFSVTGTSPTSPRSHIGARSEDVKQFLRRYREAFPDLQITIEDQVAEGDRVMTRWTSHGTHQQHLTVRLVHDAS